MELRQIRYFLEVANTLHFGRAAQNLHISEQPLNRQIKKLEQELGYPLFVCTTRSVRLTRAGEVFRVKAIKGLEELETACKESKRISEGQAGNFHIEFFSAAIFGKLPRVVARFRARYPEVNVTMEKCAQYDLAALFGKLRNEVEDIGIVVGPLSVPEGFASRSLECVRTVVAVPKAYTLAKRDCVTLRDLKDYPVLSYPTSAQPEQACYIYDLFKGQNINPHIIETADSHLMLLGMAAAGMGVVITLDTTQNFFSDQLAYLPLVDPEIPCYTTAVWKEGLDLKMVENFLNVAKTIC